VRSRHEAPLTSRAFGETGSGARNLPRFLCSMLEDGPVLVVGASEAALVAAAHHDVTVLDWSEGRLASLAGLARERGRELNLLCRDPAREELGLALRSFTNVVCLDVLERMPDDVAVLEKLQRVVEADGRLVVRVPARSWPRSSAAYDVGARRYDPESLRSALDDAGLRTLRLRHWNLAGVPTAWWRDTRSARGRGRHDVAETSPHRSWGDRALDLWYRVVERRVAFPVGMSLVAVATPLLEKSRVSRPAFARALSGHARREAYEPMALVR
jgi:SAM-dependent methyltransferase